MRKFAVFRNFSMRTKLIICYGFLISLGIITVSLVSYYRIVSSIEETAVNFSDVLLSHFGTNLENQVKNIEDLLFRQYESSKMVRTLLEKEASEGKQVEASGTRNMIEDTLFNILYAYDYFQSVLFVDKYGGVYSLKKDPHDAAIPLPEDLYGHAAMLRSRWGKCYWRRGDEGTLYLQRAVFDAQYSLYLGFIIVKMSDTPIRGLYRDTRSLLGSRIAIFSAEKEILVSEEGSDPAGLEKIEREFADGRDGDRRIVSYRKDPHIALYEPSRTSYWNIVFLIPMKEISESVRIFVFFLLVLDFVIFLTVQLLSVFISGSLTASVQKLTQGVRNVSKGKFVEIVHDETSDEIGILAQEFNHMVRTINALLESIASEKVLKQEAEYRRLEAEYHALQSQINPHFLYNALESVNCIAKIHKCRDISRFVCTLGRLLRESIDRKDIFNPLDRELRYVRDYLSLYETMYQGKITLGIHVDALKNDLSFYQVPTFILQPLVENAIVHGLETKAGPGRVDIRIREEEKSLEIEVVDDGKGMDAETLEAVGGLVSGGTPRSETSCYNVGLKSVYSRLNILFGGSAVMKISSEEGEGTKVLLVFPWSAAERTNEKHVV